MRISTLVLAVCLSSFVVSGADGAGFEIRDQGGAVAGNSYAGAAALAEDASTIFYNPAGMALLDRDEVVVSVDVLFPRGKFKNEGSFDILGTPISGTDGGNPGQAFVPSSYALWKPIESLDWLRFGFAINAPWGLSTDYEANWVGRYQALESELKTYNLNPAVSIKLSEWLSVGVGFDAQYADAKLTNAIDFGGVCVSTVGPTLCPFLGLSPQTADGHVRLTGTDWGFGYNVGVLLHPNENTRIGLGYRSHIDFELDGDANFHVPSQAAILTAGGTIFQNGGLKVDLTVPETATFGIYQKVAPKWVALFGAAWTRWSRVQELRVRFDNTMQPDAVIPANWKDSWLFSVGANYLYSDKLTLRAGVAYDESPIPDSTRTPRIPGSDAINFAVGAGYQLSDDVHVDAAYQLGILEKADIDLTDTTAGSLNGYYDFHTHVLSLQIRKTF